MPSASIVFVDTNVLLYAQDPREPDKRALATVWLSHLWHSRSGRISTQVLNEFYVNLRKAAPAMTVTAARALATHYRAWQPWLVDTATVDRAWALQDRFSFSYWDALIVAAAQQQGCLALLSEDLQHGLVVDQLRVINPFLASPLDLDVPA